MATLKQTEANRLNAQKSTGPRTEAGKAVVAQNARKHGCYAAQVVLDGQDQAEFDQLLADYMTDCQPHTLRERQLVEMMAVEWWHLGQCEFMRRSFFDKQLRKEEKYHQNWPDVTTAERLQRISEKVAFYHLKDMNLISNIKTRVYRNYFRASKEFDLARAARLRQEAEDAAQSEALSEIDAEIQAETCAQPESTTQPAPNQAIDTESAPAGNIPTVIPSSEPVPSPDHRTQALTTPARPDHAVESQTDFSSSPSSRHCPPAHPKRPDPNHQLPPNSIELSPREGFGCKDAD